MSLIGTKTIKSISSISSSDTKQTNMTNYEKSKIHKTASFHGGVEIIDVESYKLYNQSDMVKLEALENNCDEYKAFNCFFF